MPPVCRDVSRSDAAVPLFSHISAPGEHDVDAVCTHQFLDNMPLVPGTGKGLLNMYGCHGW
jgi:hypothetical protein